MKPLVQDGGIHLAKIYFIAQVALVQVLAVWQRVQEAVALEPTTKQEHVIGGAMVGAIAGILRNSAAKFGEGKQEHYTTLTATVDAVEEFVSHFETGFTKGFAEVKRLAEKS